MKVPPVMDTLVAPLNIPGKAGSVVERMGFVRVLVLPLILVCMVDEVP